MRGFGKKAILNISIFFIILQAAFTEELVIPVIKAPYSIENAQWDNSGNYFAYQVNGRVYVRDALTLLLKDSFEADSKSQLTAFYKSPNLIDYPKTSIQIKGNNLSIRTKRNQNSAESSFSITNLPVEVKAAAINPAQSHLAFIGSDGKAYIYNINDKSVVSSINCNYQSDKIYFTSDNKVLFSDSNKTAGLYYINGQKLKSYTNAKTIKGISLSPDEETLIVFEDSGNLNFFNVNNSTQLGYIPNLGSSDIKNVELSKDSRRFLITGKNNCLYIAALEDFLFSPNTRAPDTRQFSFNYNKLDPNSKNDDVVTEFGLKEITNVENIDDAEFIESTKEKGLEKQNFELADKKIAAQPVQITAQKDIKTYPSSELSTDREVTFTEEGQNVQELSTKVTEFKQNNQNYRNSESTESSEKRTIVVTNGDLSKTSSTSSNKSSSHNSKKGLTKDDDSSADTNTTLINEKSNITRTNTSTGLGTDTSTSTSTGSGSGAGTISNTNTGTGTNSGTGTGLSTGSSGSLAGTSGGLADSKGDLANASSSKTEESNANDQKDTSDKNNKDKTKKEDTKKDEKKDKDKKVINENIKTYFKDGHGILINAGVNRLRFPYIFNLSVPLGYRNYELIQPLYFGGTTEISLGIPSQNFPYYYYDTRGNLQTPKLLSIKLYSPIGFCIYPFKNSFEFYVETGLGVSFHSIWNTKFASNWISSKFYPGFYGNVKLGVAWDFLNLSICGSYDAVLGFSYGLELGLIINLNASRTIGSLVEKRNEK